MKLAFCWDCGNCLGKQGTAPNCENCGAAQVENDVEGRSSLIGEFSDHDAGRFDLIYDGKFKNSME
jgi:hypothetical protein